MLNVTLFFSTVLIWGTTWIAISLQVGEVPVVTSVFLRFALAGAIMLIALAVLKRLRKPVSWSWVTIQALCIFCLNFIGLYLASEIIASGLVALIFSLASIFNAINARLFFDEAISGRTLLAGAIGAAGLTLIFWSDLAIDFSLDTLKGIAWAGFGTLMFSFGNMASRRNTMIGTRPITANAWGMAIGALALAVTLLVSGGSLPLSDDPVYWSALVYLAVIGSIVGFTTYLVLAERIGSAQAGYVTVLFPVVALTISTFFEGYVWTSLAGIGVVLTLFGNLIMFSAQVRLVRLWRAR